MLPSASNLGSDWIATVGVCPSADMAAAHQQQALAGWAVRQWLPEMLRQQVQRDAPSVEAAYTSTVVIFVACRGLWSPAAGEQLRGRSVSRPAC